ncbi:hypothetical protein D3C76_1003340 [compost metagenome]
MGDAAFADQLAAALRHLPRRRLVGGREDQHEFLAAEAGDEVAWADGGVLQGLAHALQAVVALDMAVVVVVLLEVVDIEKDQRQRLAGALGAGPLHFQHGVEHAPVGHTGEAVLVGVFLQLLLQVDQLLFGLLALADVEHEADQRLDLASRVTHHMHDVADPHVVAGVGERPVVRLVVGAGLGLGDAERDHGVAVVRVHTLGPVIDAHPAGRAPAQQLLDLRSDVGEGHGLPVDLPGDRPGGFQQGLVDLVGGFGVVFHGCPRTG